MPPCPRWCPRRCGPTLLAPRLRKRLDGGVLRLAGGRGALAEVVHEEREREPARVPGLDPPLVEDDPRERAHPVDRAGLREDAPAQLFQLEAAVQRAVEPGDRERREVAGAALARRHVRDEVREGARRQLVAAGEARAVDERVASLLDDPGALEERRLDGEPAAPRAALALHGAERLQ